MTDRKRMSEGTDGVEGRVMGRRMALDSYTPLPLRTFLIAEILWPVPEKDRAVGHHDLCVA